MKILGLNVSHDASACVIEDGEIIFYCEAERLDHLKNSHNLLTPFDRAWAAHQPFDHIAYSMTTTGNRTSLPENYLYSLSYAGSHYHTRRQKPIHKPRPEIHHVGHHQSHAALAFYNSGFDQASVVVIDGGGSNWTEPTDEKHLKHLYRETETIYYFDYNDERCLFKRGYIKGRTTDQAPYDKPADYELFKWGSWGLGKMESLPFGKIFNYGAAITVGNGKDAGKLMGLAAYGSDNPDIAPAWEPGEMYPSQKFIDQVIIKEKPEFPLEDIAWRIQNDSFEPTAMYVDKATMSTLTDNVCLVGGHFYNVVNNYKLLKRFPDLNFYVEPNAGDSGCSIGAALHTWYKLTKDQTKRPLKTLYLGDQADYGFDLNHEKETVINGVTPADVAKILADGNLVALYQGKAEAGPRALGNRSLLYDPRDKQGRDKVNTFKKREYYRPFAGTCLEEHADQWFDMAGLKSSPYMMFAVDTWPDKREIVPALMHIDGTSRIQTINPQQNKNYYDVINEFYKITNVPMVLNTSFNMAGDTLVNNAKDALKTCREGQIPYLYCPERNMLIKFNF